jgi:predicted TIM-barrel fold metal-dependent hydrolase
MPSSKPNRIDFHHHILPPDYVSAVGAPVIGSITGKTEPPKWSVAEALELMDGFGVEIAMTSVSAPGLPLKDSTLLQRVARGCNDFAKQMSSDHPSRFGMLAALPLPDVSASLAEIAYALDVLRADGIALMTNYDGLYLGDAHFAPVFDELNRRKAVVFVHPTVCACSASLGIGVPPSMIDFPHETTTTITSLLFNATFSRCPDIRFVFSHAGGTVPYIANRIAGGIARMNPNLADSLPILKRMHYDVALSLFPQTMAALLDFVPRTQILYGTDYPFFPNALAAADDRLAAMKLDEQTLAMLERENALSLVPRFRK